MTRRALLDDAVDRLAAAGIEDARRNAEWIVEEATGADRAALYARPDVVVEPVEVALVARYVARRASGEPVQYVLGHTDFYGLRVAVTPDVLIPRPETEEVVEEALRRIRDAEAPWVLDVGTGSGAIALAVKHERPDAEVFAVDVSAGTLAVAASNADRLGLDVTFVESDALRPQFAADVPPTFDLIISNPPYVPEAERPGLQVEVRDHEPASALFVPDADPLVFYRALAGHADALLRPGGWLVAETHADLGGAVGQLWTEAGLVKVEVLPDLAGRDRIAVGRQAAPTNTRATRGVA
ncbi:peptide chain release factor N(5)-glutamine methyltransferase [Rubrivirga marina]|uniref:Release factor glutamine methyltransferase n=1 Tax=Rubrivirga marina TaxID=1196024 RepID=A0A271J0W7_9BACT|nr:peptide chain release factor N(5)-glutamine methyltransferase [Rubrivirga marina]PAP77010.1 protein-(glutamine-N5) methyltransferase, release factor-specific [Rubrivirga marina]